MRVTLTRYTPEPERAIIEAAATCWQSVPRQEILSHIIKAGHWTPLEFATFNFHIENVSRSLTHQLVRKRVGVAFCQESQRHVTYKYGFKHVTPPSILDSPRGCAYAIYRRAMRNAQAAYEQLLELGIPGEDARFVLPNAWCTIIDMTINVENGCAQRLNGRYGSW